MTEVALSKRTGPLVLAPVGLLGRPGDRPALSLADMEAAVDSLETAAIRAKDALNGATQPLGKNASTPSTRLVDSPYLWAAATGVGALAALGVYHFAGPDRADYALGVYKGRWTSLEIHRNTTWAWDVTKAVAGSLGVGASLAAGPLLGARLWSKAKRAKLARGTLDTPQLAEFARHAAGAVQRPLERAAIARVADATLRGLNDREIFVSDGAEAMLKAVAADVDLGDEQAQAEAVRHAVLIRAVRALESGKGAPVELIGNVREAFKKLPDSEQAAIRDELRERLFDGKVPRRKGVPFLVGQELYGVING